MVNIKKLLFVLGFPFLILTACNGKAGKEKEKEKNTANKDEGKKEDDFKKTCNLLLQSVIKKDTSAFNALVNPEQGFYLLFRTGAMDEMANMKKMTDEYPLKFEFIDIKAEDVEKDTLQYGEAPSFDCEKAKNDLNGWNKRGYFADSLKKYSPVSTVMGFREKFLEEKPAQKDLDAVKSMEQNSRQVVFTGKNGDGIIFYLVYLKGKWWLSVLNRLPTDCSA